MAFISAADNETNETSTETIEVSEDDSNSEKIDKAFTCLEEKVSDCKGLTVQEIALTILASPDEVTDNCVFELKKKRSTNNWGNVRDTSLAILALEHVGEDTTSAEEWLLEQSRTPTELIWYLEQDSNEKTECKISYASNDYSISVGEDKKIDKNAGTCLTRAESNFWLKISPNCYAENFLIECDEDFIATLLYKNKDSSTLYVLDGTKSSPAYGSVEIGVDSKCFGSNACDYEGTVWATVALLRTGYGIEEFIPYLVAMSSSNSRFLPSSFIYMATNYEDYASKLITEVKLGNYWLASKSSYNKYYDTSLALLALGSSSSAQITASKDWLLFSQGKNGCWQNSIRETAAVLWALEGRVASSSSSDPDDGPSTTTYCSEANFFCIPSSECPTDELRNNFYCSSLSETCCATENLQACTSLGGSICSNDEVCTGNEREAFDTSYCCTGECVERQDEVNECEEMFYTCMGSCSEFQELAASYQCLGSEVCCKTKTPAPQPEKSAWWIWALIGGIVVLLIILAVVFKDKLKGLFGGKGSKGSGSRPRPGRPGMPPRPGVRPMPRRRPGAVMPPRPGFPPVRRTHQPLVRRKADRRDSEMSDTFKKLKNMSK